MRLSRLQESFNHFGRALSRREDIDNEGPGGTIQSMPTLSPLSPLFALLPLLAFLSMACNSGGGSGGGASTLGNSNGTLSGAITGSVLNSPLLLNSNNSAAANSNLATLSLLASYESGNTPATNNQILITSPSNLVAVNLTTGITFPSLPAANTTLTNTTPGICGGVLILVEGPAPQPYSFNYLAATDCNGNAQTPTGSFALDVASTPTFVSGGAGTIIGAYYGFTGSFNVTMPGTGAALGTTTTLSVAF